LGRASGESFRVSGMGGGEHTGSGCNALLGQIVVHISGRQQAKPRVMVLGVTSSGGVGLTLSPTLTDER
jgi:hypothetical protein